LNIAYCTLLLPEEKNLVERAKKRLSGMSLHRVTSAIIQGLDQNLEHPIKIFNIINTYNYPNFPALFFPTEQWSHTEGSQDWHIGYINLFGIKYITQERGLYKKLCSWVDSLNGEKCVICVHHIYYPAMKAACNVKQKYGGQVKICLITGDMTGQYGLVASKKPTIKERLIYRLEKSIDEMAKRFDCYVLATKHMAEAFGVEDKPYAVLECTYTDSPNSEPASQEVPDEKEKIIFYAGALRDDYGIPHLLRAFSMIHDDSYRLWLAGGGAAEESYKKQVADDTRIEFLGFISPKDVQERQKKAMVLISPRTSEPRFVKYSFPSKTLECLASGKPYVAHKLPCDPPEYGDYIQYADGESDEALRDKIIQICEMTQEQREEIGEKAKAFIAREKNPQEMCKRIVDLWLRVIQ